MVDLRLFANDLVGKRIKLPKNKREQWEGRDPGKYKYVIDEVFQNYVRCTVTCENDYSFKESITVGQLIQLGLIECKAERSDKK